MSIKLKIPYIVIVLRFIFKISEPAKKIMTRIKRYKSHNKAKQKNETTKEVN